MTRRNSDGVAHHTGKLHKELQKLISASRPLLDLGGDALNGMKTRAVS